MGAMQDSFPHALELSKKGYNAFALIYRPERILPVRILPVPLRSSMRMPIHWTLT